MESLTFDELKPILKDKWLDYYEANQNLVDKLIELGYGYHQHPNPDFIVGIISYLEPRLKEYLNTFLLVSEDLDEIVKALGLDFDLKGELSKRKK